ncbi:hypothetical protein CDCA_CDCA12G3395 [Cyanidium caldarium]|uniref:Cytosol aminopeptidase domain-containing protein n=1 Tax=Cyanidium caldarium TaxID=2771 RepID=A0AAV9IZ55_CYACA|nr:hypothetical protein CDCA_CDCA12G3395 [Cyanidium caldarium]
MEGLVVDPSLPEVAIVAESDRDASERAFREADAVFVGVPRRFSDRDWDVLRRLASVEVYAAIQAGLSRAEAWNKEGELMRAQVLDSSAGGSTAERRVRTVVLYGLPGVLEPAPRLRGTESVLARKLAQLSGLGAAAAAGALSELEHVGSEDRCITIYFPAAEELGHDPSRQLDASVDPEGRVIDEACMIAIIRGVYTSSWKDTRFRGQQHRHDDAHKQSVAGFRCRLVLNHNVLSQDVNSIPLQEEAVSRGVLLTRQLVDTRANIATPAFLAHVAQRLAEEHDSLECRTLSGKECEQMGMRCYLAVGRGSSNEPRFIHLIHRGTALEEAPKQKFPRVAFVGKGVTFDSGGIQTKHELMDCMHFDKGGACALLGTAKTVALDDLPVEAHFIAPCCENMSGSNAYRPGDTLLAMNGTSVTVSHTDAEGRLTLADALVYAERLNVDCIVDVATLTGAAMVALGPEYGAVFSNHHDLLQKLLFAADNAGEKLWPMPLALEYKEQLRNDLTDTKTLSGTRWGGSIVAAVFLSQFVERTPWAHIDIAGVAYNLKKERATGYGVQLLYEFLCQLASESFAGPDEHLEADPSA